MSPLILIILLAIVAPLRAQTAKPNIVLILADDLGVNDLSCYGRKDHATPNLDKLAAQGMRFSCAYAQPVCSPSRAALLTGKSPARLHLTTFLPGRGDAPAQRLLQPVIEGQLPLEEITIAELLRDAGYATGCIGKWHLGGAGFGPKEQGFDTVVAGQAVTKPTAEEGSKGEVGLTVAAEQFIDANKERPFFLYLAHHSPHIPFAARPEDAAQHESAFSPAYADVIARLDAAVGRVMARIDALGLAERTIFIFASDNGGLHVLEFPGTPATHNTPFRAGKGFLYEGGLRVPLIVRWPGKVAPGVNDTPMVLTDLMPTMLEWTGLDPAKVVGPLDGVSLMRMFMGIAPPPRALFWHFPHYTNQGGRPGGAVREGDWKLVENYEDESVELFDLAKDPGETTNLAAQETARADGLRKKLREWRQRVGGQACAPNPAFDAAAHDAIYVTRDPSKVVVGGKTAAQLEAEWKPWRAGINAAVHQRPVVTPATGTIRLHAAAAQVHGEKLRFEPEPMKRTLGFWVNPADWASWDFAVGKPGKYEVEVLQGCGGGGSEVAVEVAGQKLTFIVENTGHFQYFIQRAIGVVELPTGPQTLAVRPQSKKGGAVMDLRQVTLRPVEK
ncbi:MAG: sulfatase-like hydrolase/transferase [Chthoniobacter sp.]|nr:sulfatase-like hydrolase/transferase [Chthoniobacter sp.]